MLILKKHSVFFAVSRAVFAALFLTLASCASAPKTPVPLAGEAAGLPLEPGAAAYIVMDVERARPILDGVNFREMNRAQSKQILDMTKTAVAAVYEEGPRRFQAVDWGKYPAFRAGLSFIFGSEWKKAKSPAGASYWRSERAGLSLALSSSQAYVSDGDPFAASGGTALPEGFGDYSRGSVLACWLPEPAMPMGRFIAALGLPLQIPAREVFLGLFPAGTGHVEGGVKNGGEYEAYEALIRIETPSVSQARALAALINLTRSALSGLPAGNTETGGGAPGYVDPAAITALLFANPPVQNGIFLSVRTAPLSEMEITLLLQIFTVYS